MSEASRRRRKVARAKLRRDRADYEAMATGLQAAFRKADERDQRWLPPAKIKPCPDPTWPGFQALSREALAGVAAVFRAAVHGRRDADRA